MFPSVHESFFLTFAQLPDLRLDRTRDHTLLDILFCSLCAVLCGAEEGIADLANGIPSHDTFTRVLGRIDPERFATCFTAWMSLLYEHSEGQVIALDGKTLRRSFDRATGKGAIHMVSAWGSANGPVLGQVKVEAKSNEITAVPKLLEMLELAESVALLESVRTLNGTTTTDCRYFISSLPPKAQQIMEAVRLHWGTENSVH